MVSTSRLVRAACAAVLLVGPLAGSGAAQAGAPSSAVTGPRVTPDVQSLPLGARPRLPYVDWPARRIVDGARRVSISGIQARVTALHKVDGGYLLARRLPVGHDLVLVTTSGARRVLVRSWLPSRAQDLSSGVAVGRNGDRLLVNTATHDGAVATYAETKVLTLPAGRTVGAETFPFPPRLLGFGVERAMLSVHPDSVWWTPATNQVDLLRAATSGQSADLSAWQWALRPDPGTYSVQGIPPDTGPDWPVDQEDHVLGPWSPDDTMIAGTNEVTDQGSGGASATAYLVVRASDGQHLLSVVGEHPPRVTWESDAALLLRTFVPENRTYQLLRCTLAGSCRRVGPATASADGAIIPATRRNS